MPPTWQSLEDLDVVIHLAGESVGTGRWTKAKKQRILSSRVGPTRDLANAIASLERPPAFLCASAVGYYGHRGDDKLTTAASPGQDFLAGVVQQWEAACDPARTKTRVVHMRTGIVLAKNGGALARMLWPFRLCLGGPMAGGRQWMPVIGRTELATRIADLAQNDRASGPVHLVSATLRQRDFARILGRVLRRPAFAPLPRFIVKLLFGEQGEALLLSSQRIVVEEPSDVEAILRHELDRPAKR